jgi:hypothetical protein
VDFYAHGLDEEISRGISFHRHTVLLLRLPKVDNMLPPEADPQAIGFSSTADGLIQQTRMIASCSAPTTMR